MVYVFWWLIFTCMPHLIYQAYPSLSHSPLSSPFSLSLPAIPLSPPLSLTGGPDQLPHLAPTYAAVLTLCTIGTDEAFAVIDRCVPPHIYFIHVRACMWCDVCMFIECAQV